MEVEGNGIDLGGTCHQERPGERRPGGVVGNVGDARKCACCALAYDSAMIAPGYPPLVDAYRVTAEHGEIGVTNTDETCTNESHGDCADGLSPSKIAAEDA